MSGILEAIERRAQARGYEVIRIRRCADEGPGVLVHDGLESVVWRVKDANTLSRVVLRGHMAKATMAHLQGSIAGEGAARVLSVVSQVAAMAWAAKHQREAYQAYHAEMWRRRDAENGGW